ILLLPFGFAIQQSFFIVIFTHCLSPGRTKTSLRDRACRALYATITDRVLFDLIISTVEGNTIDA
ncbi:hypothetical protein ACJX0J_019523, partial [Zea mays]